MNMPYWEYRYKRQGKRTVGCCSFSQKEFDRNTKKARSLLQKCLMRNNISAERLLDVGCGWGRLVDTCSSFSKEVYGIDIIPWAIEEAKKEFSLGKFSVFDGKRIPFPDKYFDLILSWTVLQHVPPENISELCDEIIRVMTSGARLIIYENISVQYSDKAHIWFRRPSEYELSFEELRMVDKELVASFDKNSETHMLAVFRKDA